MSSPTIHVYRDAATLAAAAAQHVANLAQTAVAHHGRFALALSGGSTPQALFALLAEPPFANTLPWHAMHIFWGDERLVPPDDPGSNYFHAATLLLSKVPIPPQNVHRVRGEASPTAAAADYAQALRAFTGDQRGWPIFDLVLLGLGSDGHTASLFPGPIPTAETTRPVITVTADYGDRPAQRLTLTPLVFNDARQVTFLVSGAGKAAAVAAVVGPDGAKADPQRWPAARIRPRDGRVTWLLDQDAAARLP